MTLPASQTETGVGFVDSLDRVSIVVVTRNRPSQFDACMRSLSKWCPGAELIVVDDKSSTPYVERMVPRGVKVVLNHSRKYLNTSRNIGARLSTKEYLLFLDDDNEVEMETVRLLAETLDRCPRAGVVAPAALTPDGVVWYAGGSVGKYSGYTTLGFRGAKVDSLPAWPFETGTFHNCFAVRAAVFHKTGGFDGTDFPMYFGEVDLAERIRQLGYVVIVNPRARVMHRIAFGDVRDLRRNVHITEPARAYFVGRNRLLFMRIHRGGVVALLFLVIWQPFYTAGHALSVIVSRGGKQGKVALLGSYLRGVLDGVSGGTRYGNRYFKGF